MDTDELNDRQKEASLHKNGPLLVIAGAGAGKTRTIAHRIANLIASGVRPEEILAITFTNKAAHSLRTRVAALLGRRGFDALPFRIEGEPFVGTFHSLGAHILRENSTHTGVRKHFKIWDKDEARAAIKEALRESAIDPKEHSPRKLQNIISRQKGELTTQGAYAERVAEQAHAHPFFSTVADAWKRYEQILAEENALDFDDLLLLPVMLLRKNPELRKKYGEMWRYIHIDEYQDTNEAQYELSRLLAQGHGNIAVVGDSDQNIYSWRGANIKNILRFEDDYPGATVITLEENYRSTENILEAANGVIEKNAMRKEKTMFTKKRGGELLSFCAAYDETDEARRVAHIIEMLLAQGKAARDIAVLYRANFQSRALEEALLARDIPYHVIGTRFFERKEVKDVLAYIASARNPSGVRDIRRIINTPPRGIGKATLAKLCAGEKHSLPERTRGPVESFYAALADIGQKSRNAKPSELVLYVLTRTGLEEYLRSDGEEGAERLLNIRELASLASRFDALPGDEGTEELLIHAALASDQDALIKDGGGVRLMTVHAAKGLEFSHVFIVGLEQGLFPYEDAGENNGKDAEEERRLFYVALTRAQEKVFLSCAGQRNLFGSRYSTIPSEFLGDIPERLLDVALAHDEDAVPDIV